MLVVSLLLSANVFAADESRPNKQGNTSANLSLDSASWQAEEHRLSASGTAGKRQTIQILNAATNQVLGETRSGSRGDWQFNLTINSNAQVPCRIQATNGSQSASRDVQNAPANCNNGGGGTPPPVVNGDFTVLAANDLGMHCADLDYQVFSILPPFNVVHAQVILRGTSTSLPRVVDNNTVNVFYSATSSVNDPAGSNSINMTSRNLTGVYKSNFWDMLSPTTTYGGKTYGPLYPSILAVDPTNTCQTVFNCPSALTLFDPLAIDVGIPVPDPKALFPVTGSPSLVIDQQAMPGLANTAQQFDRFDDDLPFFVNFPFGSRVQNVNWFAADGIPLLPIDDIGRPNAYPLMRVAAHSLQDNSELASVDVVLPVASEADCQNCHVEPIDCADPGLPADVITDNCTGAAVSQTAFDVMTLDNNPPGGTRLQQLLNTAKINILRVHDAKHGASYRNWNSTGQLVNMSCNASDPNDANCLQNQTPVQCSRCHYSPALDLAQVGPIDEPTQGLGGRQQTVHISMSRAMHGHHGALPPFNGQELFPPMPPPINRSVQVTQSILEQTCYQCHPGKRTKCLRGAMSSGNVVCQDCHGDMAQVGDDFTQDLPNTPFPNGADLSKRVPWASEPACQSCHTGDAVSNLAGTPNTITADPNGIRLAQAYLTSDASATPIVAVNKRFAESESLFRLSKGHGGVMCEACHGSTHAIWPIQNALANDNVAAQQLQGHSGSLIECSTCHAPGSLGLTLDGPHGMHPVGDSNWNHNHEDFAQRNRDSCRACHGQTGEGTVLSRMAVTRTLRCDGGSNCNNGSITLTRGTQVGCGTCHSNELR